MLDKLINEYGIYGDEEETFDCGDMFEALTSKVIDNEIDLQTVIRFLLSETTFLDWIEETYHKVEKSECDECCEDCMMNDYDDQVDMFNAQAEILKNTQEELSKLKKKYNNLLRKYKELKGSL